ncbi:hypothetical protein SEVIR_1G291350v4 [Setaria viridis]
MSPLMRQSFSFATTSSPPTTNDFDFLVEFEPPVSLPGLLAPPFQVLLVESPLLVRMASRHLLLGLLFHHCWLCPWPWTALASPLPRHARPWLPCWSIMAPLPLLQLHRRPLCAPSLMSTPSITQPVFLSALRHVRLFKLLQILGCHRVLQLLQILSYHRLLRVLQIQGCHMVPRSVLLLLHCPRALFQFLKW